MWEAIKSRFGGNDELKKMQKYILKQQFEGFSVSNSEGLHKGYDRSLPSAWSQVSLIMRTKPGVDSLSFDDLYNSLRVFESDVKGSTASSSSTHNVAFVSENTSSTNNVSTAYGVSNSSGHNSQYEHPSSYFLLANQSSCLQLDHEDLEQLDEFDLEEIDLKWQVAMISMRMKKFYKKTGRKLQFDAKELVGFDKTKVECYSCQKTGHFARECRSKGNKENGRRSGKQEDSKALVTLDGEGVDWTSHSEDEQENYAFMACSSSGSNTEVTSCSKECKESYAKLKKLYDEQREQLGDASIEIQAYTQALKKVEAELVAYQQSQLWYGDKISQMSARDKAGLGYGDQMNKGVLSYENEVFQRIYIPYGPDKEIDDSQFIYGLKQSKPSESDARSSDFNTYESNCSKETHESMPEPVVNEPKVVSQPKVWSDAPIIEEYESDSEDKHAVPTNAARKVNTVKPILNNARPKLDYPQRALQNKGIDYPQRALQNKGIVDSGCSRHMSGNKDYLAEYQDFNGGPVAFSRSKCYIAGKGKGPTWLFDLDYLTDSMNYQPMRFENQANKHACPKEANHSVGTEDNIDAGNYEIEAESAQVYFVLPIWSFYTSTVKSSKTKNVGEEPNKNHDLKTDEKPVAKEDQVFLDELERLKRQEHDANNAAEALRKEFAKDTEDLL
ncbi:ribonuclease H-like domain-containing protein, partial [Tanacetum coccineum]